jgi:hypothetical protein
MSDSDSFLTEEGMFKLIGALTTEVINHGQREADLVGLDAENQLTSEQIAIIMKTNTLLSTFAGVLVKIVERQNPKFAQLVLEVWTSPAIQELVEIAFVEEINGALLLVEESINRLEQEINQSDRKENE